MLTQKRVFSFLILSVALVFFLAGCVLPFSSQEGGEVEATPTADPNQGGGIEQPAEESSAEQPVAEVEAEVETEPAEETAVTEETTVEEETTTETTPAETTEETTTTTETQPSEENPSETAEQPEQEPSETSPMPPTPTPTSPTTTTACPVTHTVQAGENLYRIGLQYGMSWVPIASANGLSNPNALRVGQVLIIPVEGCAPVPPTPQPPVGGTTYVVQPGDNLFRIGLKFGISWVQIAEANGIVNPNQIYVGQVLKIPVAQPGPTPNFTHLVQYGETLFIISIHYGVPWQAIAAANQIPPPYIVYAGQTIIIPGSW